MADTRTGCSPITLALAGIGAGALAVGASAALLNLFGPTLPYVIREGPEGSLDSEKFVRFLTVVTDGTLHRCRVMRLHNGEEFYSAEFEAIRDARHSINLEYYEFGNGRVPSVFLDALMERARAGVQVRLTVDAAGSFQTPAKFFERLTAAGGQMRWYNPLRPLTWQRVNNRTHRKLLTVDGRIGFIGGAGIDDRWFYGTRKSPPWRDTVLRVEGEAVAGLVSTFSENWLESAGEILSGPGQFDFQPAPDGARGFVVVSTPHGGGTQARILFQALIHCAKKSLCITTPYFLPDRSARRALIHAARRGVHVRILTAGPYIDHPLVRKMSRIASRHLVEAGAEIHEYQPSMIHAKLLTVDSQWCVAGSTNFDHRSFGLNDEVNLAVLDPELAATLEDDFAQDLRESRRLTQEMLHERGFMGRAEQILDRGLRRES
jgi:cardiolipin synthase